MELFDYMLGFEQGKKSGGGGGGSAIVYTSIIDNGDNTITAMDDKGVEHIISYVVGADGKITSVTLDGKAQTVSYDENGVLTAIGETDVNIETVPVANEFPINVTFMNGETEHAKAGVTENGKIGEPVQPTGQGVFVGWGLGTSRTPIQFPYIASDGDVFNALYSSLAD